MRLECFAVRWRAVFKYLSCHFDIEPGPDGPFFDAAGMVPIMAPERKQRDRHIEKIGCCQRRKFDRVRKGEIRGLTAFMQAKRQKILPRVGVNRVRVGDTWV